MKSDWSGASNITRREEEKKRSQILNIIALAVARLYSRNLTFEKSREIKYSGNLTFEIFAKFAKFNPREI